MRAPMPEIYAIIHIVLTNNNNSHAKVWIPFNFYYGRMRRDGAVWNTGLFTLE